MDRTFLVHLNVAVPANDGRTVEEIEEQIAGALEVGLDPLTFPDTRVVIALAEEV